MIRVRYQWRGVTEHEGRRGMLAFLYGLLLGVPLGFWIGFKLAWWLCTGGGGSRAAIGLGALLCVLGVLALGVPALLAGIHLAERRGVSHSGGERTAWALRRVALQGQVVPYVVQVDKLSYEWEI